MRPVNESTGVEGARRACVGDFDELQVPDISSSEMLL